MLHLRKDLFARLVTSAHKDRRMNSLFKVSHVEASAIYSKKKIEAKPDPKLQEISRMETAVANAPITKSTVTKIIPQGRPVEKIDEKVSKIVDDPKLAEIKMELEFAEELLKRIKIVDTHNPKIPVIEANILKLKSMLGQKMYV